MKISREWATPITIGAFSLMAVTGLLMFFHLDSGLNKFAHEWLGWVFVAGVSFHAAVNWAAFKRHFVSSKVGRAIVAAFAIALLASFVPLGGRGAAPPVLAMNAIAKAPLSAIAPLTGRPVEALVSELKNAGIDISGPDTTIASATGRSREAQGKAIAVLFGGGARD
ncbi:DUF4405 domain-containing protein [Rhodoblastus acidophilus]|uniref:DUF4405 domain-containing protein n=1 Tax=Candidatus Rhodoblastus alkanivorans TaxID=2954117 RepID=A0ABS9ZB84_9HYPH|nr:DUF4405 domain-containing protein [Candidatus Rhodoblastus alkanivorans]MCI4679361.1 DUF4405 domain-containing protein [Candidatus Rhodoblastus alkanivorans]MCI4684837.1 DUF4405 domain-containing protein [Candidatus Rhodoblastus alkanivorans]MDI4642161.1 DUF4405 domain-containing protein [Rhodoblastus acidophilus]